MDWWVLVLAIGLLLSPFYVFILSKFAGAGWMSGLRAYIKSTNQRNK